MDLTYVLVVLSLLGKPSILYSQEFDGNDGLSQCLWLGENVIQPKYDKIIWHCYEKSE